MLNATHFVLSGDRFQHLTGQINIKEELNLCAEMAMDCAKRCSKITFDSDFAIFQSSSKATTSY